MTEPADNDRPVTHAEAAAPPPRALSWQASLLRAPATLVFYGIAIVVFALAEQSGDTRTIGTLVAWGASARELVWAGEYWRFVTPMFLHIGLIHLVWNVYGGWSWARQVEPALGTVPYAAVYLLSGIGGTAASLLAQNAVSAGASGALFGITGAFLTLGAAAHGGWRAFAKTGFFRTNALNIGVWFVIGAFAGFDNWAHAGGFAVGVFATSRLVDRTMRQPVWIRLAPVVAVVGAAVALAAVPR